MSVVAALAALCSPETRDKPLPETIEEFDAGPVYNWLFGKKKKENQQPSKHTTSTDEQPTISKLNESGTLLEEAK